MQVLTWTELRALMGRRPKPAMWATVSEQNDDHRRDIVVAFDGQEGWFISDGETTEITFQEGRTLLRRKAGDTVMITDARLAGSTGVKAMLVGTWAYEGTGTVTGTTTFLGRGAYVAEVSKVRRDEPDAIFDQIVDRETGITLRLARRDNRAILEVTSLDFVRSPTQGSVKPT